MKTARHINLPFYLFVFLIYRKPFTRSPLRSAGMLHGSDNVHCPVWGCFDASKLYIIFNEFLCCAFANIYISPYAICRVRIGRQVAHLGPWRTIYNYKEQIFQCPSAGTASLPLITPSTGTCTSKLKLGILLTNVPKKTNETSEILLSNIVWAVFFIYIIYYMLQ